MRWVQVQGSNSAMISFLLRVFFDGDQHLEERFCSSRSKFFPLKVRSHFGRDYPGKQSVSH